MFLHNILLLYASQLILINLYNIYNFSVIYSFSTAFWVFLVFYGLQLAIYCYEIRDVNGTRFSRVPKKFPVLGKEISRSGEFRGNCKIHTKLACVTRNRRRQP